MTFLESGVSRLRRAEPRKKQLTSSGPRSSITFKPHDYQEEGVKWLLTKPESGLFWPPGLGKTAVALAAFHVRKRRNKRLRMLVIAKRRICHRVWPREVRKWGFPYSCTVLHGNRKAVYDGADIHCINYESLNWIVPLIKKRKVKYDMMVVDESSQVRNARTLRFRMIKKIMNSFSYRHILTGTPAPRGLMGLWSQLFILDGGDTLGDSIVRYRNRFFYPCGYKGKEYTLQEDGEGRIYKLLRSKILHVGSDKLKNMPKAVNIFVPIELPPEAMLAYKTLEQELIVQLREGTVTASNAAVATQKLRQVANGKVYFPEEGMKKVASLHLEKAEKLLDIVEEIQGTPALVSYDFHHDLQSVFEVFGEEIPHIGGDTSDAEADYLEDEWNAGRLPVLLGHPDSVAHGLNLQESGNVVVYYSMTWNYENYEQFYQRVLRQGQKAKKVFIYHLIAKDTVDEVMAATLQKRGNLQQRLFEALKQHYGVTNMTLKKKAVSKKRTDTPSKPKPVPKTFKPKAKVADMLKAIQTAANVHMGKDDKGKPRCFPLELHDDKSFGKFSVQNWWLMWLQILGAASPKEHEQFQSEVLLAKDVIKTDNLGDLYRFSKAAAMTVLKAREENGVITMEDPDILKDWPVIKDLGPVSSTKGESDMAAKKKAAAKKKTATKKTPVKKKTGGNGATKKGQVTPIGTADWDKLPLNTKVKADKAKAGEANAKIKSVLDVIGGKTTTIQKLLDAGLPRTSVYPAVNRYFLVIQK